MRKLTLYQAAKYSKISRYKLEQAIKQGLLKIQEGKGNIKYFINEKDLKEFLEDHGDQFIKHNFNGETTTGSIDNSNVISKDLHDQMMREKERIIRLLEFQNEKYFPLIPDSEKITLHITQKYTNQLTKLQELFNKAVTIASNEERESKEKIREQADKIFSDTISE